MKLPIVYTTVFGATPTGGNPCPIVFEADALTAEQMRALAARFASETAFVLAPHSADADLRLRYFVPNHEMEMCIHATVGAVTVLVQQKRIAHSPLRVETPLGIIAVHWSAQDAQIDVIVEQFPPTFAKRNPPRDAVARVLGLPANALDGAQTPVQSVSTARAKLMIPLTDWQTLYDLQPDFAKLWALCDAYETTGLYPFTTRVSDPLFDVEARQFPRRAGYNEDPATGVAACALNAYCAHHGVLAPRRNGTQRIRVGQGHAMGRPSVITATCEVVDGRVVQTAVGGRAVMLRREDVQIVS